MNSEKMIAGNEEVYLEHYEKNADGTKSSRGWCDA